MIIYPEDWNRDWCNDAQPVPNIPTFVIEFILRRLSNVLSSLGINHLAYSGGIDSSILLCLMTKIYPTVYTYTISNRDDHPDVLFSWLGSKFYGSIHKVFIDTPTNKDSDMYTGDNAVRQLFENIEAYTNYIVCGDGIDEFTCGYHKHKDLNPKTYEYFLGDLLEGHLLPLNKNSHSVNVCLPYLDKTLVELFRFIPLGYKVSLEQRKIIMVKLAEYLNVPKEIITRHKYGFIDAFIKQDKSL